MKQNRKLWGIVAGLAALALLVGGTSVASNMGFKFVPNVGANEFFNLSLPWNNNYAKAVELFNDLPGSVAVTRINPNNSKTTWSTGAPTTANFDVVSGEGYVVQAGGSGVTTAVIVGSHNPNQTLDFAANEFFNAAAPYHQTHTKVVDLFTDLNNQLGDPSAIVGVTRINPNNSKTTWSNGAPTTANFDLTLGAAVVIQAGAGGSGYVWPHY